MTERQSRMPDLGWFEGAGLGIFVHWDHASQQGIEIEIRAPEPTNALIDVVAVDFA